VASTKHTKEEQSANDHKHFSDVVDFIPVIDNVTVDGPQSIENRQQDQFGEIQLSRMFGEVYAEVVNSYHDEYLPQFSNSSSGSEILKSRVGTDVEKPCDEYQASEIDTIGDQIVMSTSCDKKSCLTFADNNQLLDKSLGEKRLVFEPEEASSVTNEGLRVELDDIGLTLLNDRLQLVNVKNNSTVEFESLVDNGEAKQSLKVLLVNSSGGVISRNLTICDIIDPVQATMNEMPITNNQQCRRYARDYQQFGCTQGLPDNHPVLTTNSLHTIVDDGNNLHSNVNEASNSINMNTHKFIFIKALVPRWACLNHNGTLNSEPRCNHSVTSEMSASHPLTTTSSLSQSSMSTQQSRPSGHHFTHRHPHAISVDTQTSDTLLVTPVSASRGRRLPPIPFTNTHRDVANDCVATSVKTPIASGGATALENIGIQTSDTLLIDVLKSAANRTQLRTPSDTSHYEIQCDKPTTRSRESTAEPSLKSKLATLRSRAFDILLVEALQSIVDRTDHFTGVVTTATPKSSACTDGSEISSISEELMVNGQPLSTQTSNTLLDNMLRSISCNHHVKIRNGVERLGELSEMQAVDQQSRWTCDPKCEQDKVTKTNNICSSPWTADSVTNSESYIIVDATGHKMAPGDSRCVIECIPDEIRLSVTKVSEDFADSSHSDCDGEQTGVNDCDSGRPNQNDPTNITVELVNASADVIGVREVSRLTSNNGEFNADFDSGKHGLISRSMQDNDCALVKKTSEIHQNEREARKSRDVLHKSEIEDLKLYIDPNHVYLSDSSDKFFTPNKHIADVQCTHQSIEQTTNSVSLSSLNTIKYLQLDHPHHASNNTKNSSPNRQTSLSQPSSYRQSSSRNRWPSPLPWSANITKAQFSSRGQRLHNHVARPRPTKSVKVQPSITATRRMNVFVPNKTAAVSGSNLRKPPPSAGYKSSKGNTKQQQFSGQDKSFQSNTVGNQPNHCSAGNQSFSVGSVGNRSLSSHASFNMRRRNVATTCNDNVQFMRSTWNACKAVTGNSSQLQPFSSNSDFSDQDNADFVQYVENARHYRSDGITLIPASASRATDCQHQGHVRRHQAQPIALGGEARSHPSNVQRRLQSVKTRTATQSGANYNAIESRSTGSLVRQPAIKLSHHQEAAQSDRIHACKDGRANYSHVTVGAIEISIPRTRSVERPHAYNREFRKQERQGQSACSPFTTDRQTELVANSVRSRESTPHQQFERHPVKTSQALPTTGTKGQQQSVLNNSERSTLPANEKGLQQNNTKRMKVTRKFRPSSADHFASVESKAERSSQNNDLQQNNTNITLGAKISNTSVNKPVASRKFRPPITDLEPMVALKGDRSEHDYDNINSINGNEIGGKTSISSGNGRTFKPPLIDLPSSAKTTADASSSIAERQKDGQPSGFRAIFKYLPFVKFHRNSGPPPTQLITDHATQIESSLQHQQQQQHDPGSEHIAQNTSDAPKRHPQQSIRHPQQNSAPRCEQKVKQALGERPSWKRF